MEILGYIGAVLMGISLGLIGGGGSILSVPIFVYLFGISPVLATAYSLFVVGLTALVGSLTFMRRGLVRFDMVGAFAVPSFLGVFGVRKYVIPAIPETVFTLGAVAITRDILIMGIFAIVMLMAAFSMIRDQRKEQDSESPIGRKKVKVPLVALEGLIVGGVTGLVGAGGGFLIIPALVLLAGLTMKEAVGTSLLIIAVKSLLGFLGDLRPDAQIDWTFLLVFSAIATAGIFVGSALNRVVPGSKLKPAFGWFVLVMGGYILFKQFSG